jgi:hypothetical protein
MDVFLDSSYLPKLTQQDINHFNQSIVSNAIETVTKSFLTKKSPGLGGITLSFTRALKNN